MKREQFIIEYGNVSTTATTWNSSIRKIEKIVSAIAKSLCVTYNLVDSESIKGESGHVRGYRKWSSSKGADLLFTVNKVE